MKKQISVSGAMLIGFLCFIAGVRLMMDDLRASLTLLAFAAGIIAVELWLQSSRKPPAPHVTQRTPTDDDFRQR